MLTINTMVQLVLQINKENNSGNKLSQLLPVTFNNASDYYQTVSVNGLLD